jgi:hypothetical protein
MLFLTPPTQRQQLGVLLHGVSVSILRLSKKSNNKKSMAAEGTVLFLF